MPMQKIFIENNKKKYGIYKWNNQIPKKSYIGR